MTTYETVLTRCGVCGAESPQGVLTSTSSFGWPDLDRRPAEPERSSIFLWVQECPACGYCADALESGTEDLQEIIDWDDYRALMTDLSWPALASRFMRHGLILEEIGDEAGAAWRAVNAAWVCDDEGAGEPAAKARLRAVELFQLEISEGGAFGDSEEIGDQLAEEHVLLAELFRRAGRPDEARAECAEGLKHCDDERFETLIRFQLTLLDSGDAERHSFEELSNDA